MPTLTIPALRQALALFVVALLLPASAALAFDGANPLEQNTPNQGGGNNGNNNAGGNNAGLAPPTWCVPGARLTYYGGDSITPDNPTETNRGAGGMGFSQYDIVAVTDNAVVYQKRAYFEPGDGQPNELMAISSFVTNDFGTGGGLWMHPDHIAQTQADLGGNPKITHGPWEIDGQTYDAILFETTTADGQSVTVEVYDRATGIRLASSLRTRTATGRAGSHREFKTYRVMELPWLNTTPGPAFAEVKTINSRGTNTYLSGFAEIPNFVTNLTLEATIEETNDHYVRMTTVIETSAPGMDPTRGENTGVVGPGQIMGQWIDPAILAQLEKGQVIDEDATVGQSVVVSDITQRNGRTYVALTETGRSDAYELTAVYDLASGLAMFGRLTQPSMGTVIEIEVTGVE